MTRLDLPDEEYNIISDPHPSLDKITRLYSCFRNLVEF